MKKSFDDNLAYVDSSGVPLGIETDGAFIKEHDLEFDEATYMMKRLAKRPWASHEDAERIYIYRLVCGKVPFIDKAPNIAIAFW